MMICFLAHTQPPALREPLRKSDRRLGFNPAGATLRTRTPWETSFDRLLL
jgi:hypothetical protein